MNWFIFSAALMYVVGLLMPAPATQTPETVSREPADAGIAADSVKQDTYTVAYTAIDRQCGSCHHGDRSTKTAALAIFDLRDSCWYCQLTPKQCQALKGHIASSSFTGDERASIVALIAHLSDDDTSTD